MAHISLPSWLTALGLTGAWLRRPASRDRQEPGPQEWEAGPAIRLALDQLELGDLPFDGAGAPVVLQGRRDGRAVAVHTAGELATLHHRAAFRRHQPRCQ